jgi:hypothetical protein
LHDRVRRFAFYAEEPLRKALSTSAESAAWSAEPQSNCGRVLF